MTLYGPSKVNLPSPNMNVHDNILIAHEILSISYKRAEKKGYTTIILDMEKAHDRLG